jgi:hypothetical protein
MSVLIDRDQAFSESVREIGTGGDMARSIAAVVPAEDGDGTRAGGHVGHDLSARLMVANEV